MVMMWSPAGKSTRDVEHTAPGRGVEGGGVDGGRGRVEGEGWMVKREGGGGRGGWGKREGGGGGVDGEEGGWRGRSGW